MHIVTRTVLRSVLLLCACSTLGQLPAIAQTSGPQSAGPDEVLRVTSRLVVLDVVVVDRAGNFVPNLDRSQFHITEDKNPQTIRNFDPPAGHAMPGDGKVALVNSSADLPRIGNAPVNVLVFDEVNTPYMQIAYARGMMEKYLKQQPEILPVPTLFIAAGSSRIVVLHDYTQSRAELLASIKTHTTEADFTAVVSSINGGSGGATYGLTKTLGALSQVATSVRGIPGRKNVIWVGTGYRNADDAVALSTTDQGRLDTVIKGVTNRMLAARVTLYMVDPEGVAFHYGSAESVASMQTGLGEVTGAANDSLGPGESFENFTLATGGRVLFGRNDVDAEIGKSASEGSLYYTLAYVPTTTSGLQKDYRNIRVTLTDPSLRAITRTGYFGEDLPVPTVAPNTAKRQPKELVFDLLSAARTTLVYSGLHTEAKRSKAGFTVLVSASDLHWSDQPDSSRLAEVTVIAVCYSAKGKELSQHAAELKQQIEASDRIDNGAKAGFAFPMMVPFGTTRVRIVLRDANTGTMGSADATL